MATTSVRTVFLDTNILLRANVAEAPLHAEALAAIRALRARGDALWDQPPGAARVHGDPFPPADLRLAAPADHYR